MPVGALLDTAARAGAGRVVRRAWRAVRYRWIYPCLPPGRPSTARLGPPDGRASTVVPPAGEGALERAAALREGRFELLNMPAVRHGTGFDWRGGPGHDPLWLYTLHYGGWALDLALAHRRDPAGGYLRALVRLTGDWLAGNRPGSRPGWEPYPVARRLVNWSMADLVLTGDDGWPAARQAVAESLRRQADLLGANLERDLGNNHLLADYCALARMGLLYPDWPGAAAWRAEGLRGLGEECRRQILPDGAHFERSASYQAIVRDDIAGTVRLAAAVGCPTPDDLTGALERMAAFRRRVAAPDGSIPLWNDSVPGYPEGLESCGDPPPAGRAIDLLADAGLAVLRDGAGGTLWFDCGPMGPRHLPGHGHADTLSICLYGCGRWLVADPGTVSYHDPALRNALRSTAAHATVAVDGRDQCLFWGPFRVAWPPAARIISSSALHAEGEHDGYRRLADPVTHRRRVELRGEGSWLIDDRWMPGGGTPLLCRSPLLPGPRCPSRGASPPPAGPTGSCSPAVTRDSRNRLPGGSTRASFRGGGTARSRTVGSCWPGKGRGARRGVSP